MSWLTSLTLLKFVLQIAASLAAYLQTNKLLDVGAQLEISKMLVAINDKAGIARNIETITAKMTPDEILQDLKNAGELRN